MTSGRPGRDRLLELVGVTQRFGGVVALSGVDLSVPEGSIFALIGPNGAGKTTVFNLVTGVYTPTEGEIRFDGTRDLRAPAAPGDQARASPGRSRTSGCSTT